MKVFIRFLFFLPIVYASKNYDFFQLVLQWPPTVCTSNNCIRLPGQLNFTIHGFWPSNSCRTDHPECHGRPFNRSEIEDLLPKLNKCWPNLTGDCNECFWKNQWETYGTCSEDKFNQHEYFSKAIELKKNVDILGYLNDGGIKPLPPKVAYRSSDISDVIEHGGPKFNGTGDKPRLWCKDNELLEISVCYDETRVDIIDCPPRLLNYPINKCNECVGYYPCPESPDPPPAASES